MNPALEKQFEEIARKAVEEAEAVECDGVDFVEGLRYIRSEIQSRIETAADEFEKE